VYPSAVRTEAFPESANAWDSLAEAHMKAGDDELAQQYYHRSLGLDPGNQNAKEMLAKIEESAGN
jgi:Tfp pilus assembly protein PilF